MGLDLFIFAGERSGDLHGKELLDKLYANNPTLKVAGVAGPAMRETAMDVVLRSEHFETMGFIDIIPALPRLIKLFKRVKQAILNANPKLVILIDYAEFNLRMAKALRKSGYKGKIIQYISPTVWAWRKERIHTMAKNLDHVLCILPFEPACFENTPLKASYIGHPLLKEKSTYDPSWKRKFDKPILALFPGSRLKEIKRNLPIQIGATKKLLAKHALQPIISCAHAKFLRPILKINTPDFPIVDLRHTHNLMHDASFAFATSGTITLQLALHNIPTCINFAIRRHDQFIAQHLLKIHLPYYGLPNIILNQSLFPEFYGTNLTIDALTSAMDHIIQNPDSQAQIKTACQSLHQLLTASKNPISIIESCL